MCIALWVNYEETFTIALAFDVSFVAERKAISRTRRQRSIQSSKEKQYFTKYLQVRRARSYMPIPKMLPHHISMICTRPFGRIDDVALKRWALYTVE